MESWESSNSVNMGPYLYNFACTDPDTPYPSGRPRLLERMEGTGSEWGKVGILLGGEQSRSGEGGIKEEVEKEEEQEKEKEEEEVEKEEHIREGETRASI